MARYLVVAAMVWDIAYSKRKWLQQQELDGAVPGGNTRICWAVTGGCQGHSAGTSPGSAKQHKCAVHPPNSLHTPLACRWGWRNWKGKQGTGQGAPELSCPTEWALRLHCPGLPGESDAGLTLPPGHKHHHKVLIWETGQAMQTSQPRCHPGLGALGWGGSGHRAPRGQQKAKGHTPAYRDTGHSPHPPKGLSCLCLRGDSKASLIQNIRGSPGSSSIQLFTSRHRPGLQARHLHKAQTNKGDSGRYSRPLALGMASTLQSLLSTGNNTAHGNQPHEVPHPTTGWARPGESVDRAGRRELQIPMFAELHLATLKCILKCLLTDSLHSPAPGVQGAAGIDLPGVLKGWSWAQHKMKGISVLLYVINWANKEHNSTMCVCRMAKAFQGEEDVRGRTLHTRWQEHRGMAVDAPSSRWQSVPLPSLPQTHTQLWPFQQYLVVYRLTEDPPPHL